MFGISAFSESPFSSLPEVGDAGQNLQPARYDNTNTFYGPTVTATYALTASRFENTNTFYGPTASATYALTAARYDNAQTFYGPTVNASNTLTAARYDNAQTFYGPVVTTAYNLTAERYNNEQTFYAPVVASSYALTAVRYDNENALYAPTVTRSAVNLTPDLYENQNAFYSAIITQEGGPQHLVADRFDNANVFYLHSIKDTQTNVVEGGGKGSSGRKKRRAYLERNGQVYVFADESQAEAWSRANQESTPKKKRGKVSELVSAPLDRIDIGSAVELAGKYNQQFSLNQLIDANNYEALVSQYRSLIAMESRARLADADDEEDIAILLMAA
jgi:hypothetical protein